jgi:L-seryl-tRNA(Ser) seleniumtransferase
MWARRKFLETISTLPLVGGFLGTSGALGAVAEASAVAAAGAAAKNGSDYFRDLGVKPFINASGTYTAMTASLMPPEVMDAIQYASKHFVMLDELHDRVGERIASLVKCEAAMVSSGAASAMMVGTAGVLTGMDREKVGKLPKLEGMKNEVIIQKSHRFGYDHAVRACGVTLVEVETREEMEKAITDKTAMMLFYNNNNSLGKVRDEEFVKIGKARGVPTMNDCAADVPPVENLWKYTAMGFDLVTFSGGKGIRGPQSAGMLLGRKDLVAAARLNAPPNASIGRGLKVNKEEMLGMLVALELFIKKDFAKEQQEFAARAEEIRKAVTSVAGVTAEVWVPEVANHVPHIKVSLPADKKAADIVKAMREGEPSIAIRNEGEQLVMSTWMMRPGEDKIVARRLKQVLEGKA